MKTLLSIMALVTLTACVPPKVAELPEFIGGSSEIPEQPLLATLSDTVLASSQGEPGYVGSEGIRSIDEQFVDEQLIGSAKFHKINNKKLSAYAKSIANKLVLTLPENRRPEYQIFITFDDAISAHATFQNEIYLRSGVFRNLKFEDELAFVLSHELAHLVLNHNQYSVDRAGDNELFESLKETAISLVGVSNLDVKKMVQGGDLNSFRDAGKANEQMKKVSQVGRKIIQVKKGLIDPSFTRNEEQDADYLAMDMMVNAGYNAKGLYEYMKKVKQYRSEIKDVNKRRNEAIGEAQKEFQQYTNKLTQELAANPLAIKEKIQQQGIDPAAIKSMMMEKGIKVFVSWGEDYFQKFKNGHFNPDKRTSLAKKYYQAHYHEQDPTKIKKNEYAAVYKSSDFSNAINDMMSIQAIELDVEGENNPKELNKLSSKLFKIIKKSKTTTRVNENSYPWIVLANIRKNQKNRGKDVVENLTIAAGKKDPHYSAFSLLSQIYIDKDNYKQAEKVIGKGLAKFNNEAIFSVQSSRVAAKNGNMEKAKKLDEKCQKQYQSKKSKGKGRCMNIVAEKDAKNKLNVKYKEKVESKKSS